MQAQKRHPHLEWKVREDCNSCIQQGVFIWFMYVFGGGMRSCSLLRIASTQVMWKAETKGKLSHPSPSVQYIFCLLCEQHLYGYNIPNCWDLPFNEFWNHQFNTCHIQLYLKIWHDFCLPSDDQKMGNTCSGCVYFIQGDAHPVHLAISCCWTMYVDSCSFFWQLYDSWESSWSRNALPSFFSWNEQTTWVTFLSLWYCCLFP